MRIVVQINNISLAQGILALEQNLNGGLELGFSFFILDGESFTFCTLCIMQFSFATKRSTVYKRSTLLYNVALEHSIVFTIRIGKRSSYYQSKFQKCVTSVSLISQLKSLKRNLQTDILVQDLQNHRSLKQEKLSDAKGK